MINRRLFLQASAACLMAPCAIKTNKNWMYLNTLTYEEWKYWGIDLEPLYNSIKKYGVCNPIITTRDGLVLDGRARCTVAEMLRIEIIPVRIMAVIDYYEYSKVESIDGCKVIKGCITSTGD